ncbi:MAG: hypothetical protein WB792_00845 [Desulfobacterales bacterium]
MSEHRGRTSTEYTEEAPLRQRKEPFLFQIETHDGKAVFIKGYQGVEDIGSMMNVSI